MAFSASDAAFEGFRVTRSHPLAVAAWALLTVTFSFAATMMMINMAGPSLMEIMRIAESGVEPDPLTILPLFGDVMGANLLLAIPGLAFMSILFTAIFRATAAESGRDRLAFLRLGAAEARAFAVWLVICLMMIVAMMLGGVALSIPATMLSMAVGGPQSAAGQMLVSAVLYLGLFFVMMAVWVRLSFAGPMTFLQNRIRIFSSWSATSGRFWALFGAYLVVFVMVLVVGVLGFAIGLGVMVALGGDIASLTHPDMSSVETYFTPGMTGYLIVTWVFSMLNYVILLAPTMAAYRAVRGREPSAA